MLLNPNEKMAMNNPIRSACQRWYEAPRLLRLGGRISGRALEIGCGRGVGIELIFDRFGAERVDALDLDPHMVELARARCASRGERVSIAVGDAEHLAFEDGTFDAVFDFGIVHHVPDWRGALCEVARVLRPGGRFFAEEPLGDFIDARWIRRWFEHPLETFTDEQFRSALQETGLREVRSERLGSFFGFYVAEKTQT